MPRVDNPNVLVGFETNDDAGVYRISENLALVQTVDFFTPIVDDPFTFGAITAANSLSDVYAMGGRPVSALSIAAFPGSGDLEVLEAILRGGVEKMREAGCAVVGGHSINDPEIKFGYAVTGTIDPARIRYAGITPTLAGLYQINVALPETVPTAPKNDERPTWTISPAARAA